MKPKIRFWQRPDGTFRVKSADGHIVFDDLPAAELDRMRTQMTHLDWEEGEGEPPKIGFVVREYSGAEVYRLIDEKIVKEPIKQRDGLREGDVVACPSLLGYFKAKIERMEDGSLCARAGDHIGFLEFSTDDRECWTCGGTANLAGIRRLEIQREG